MEIYYVLYIRTGTVADFDIFSFNYFYLMGGFHENVCLLVFKKSFTNISFKIHIIGWVVPIVFLFLLDRQ